ncbi:MAG: organoarsenical effux MFS transporter ArsJ [Gemmobacter sp.]
MAERQAQPEGLAAFAAVTAAYWAFMLTDGALRMLVLLQFHILGFTPFQLAWLFLLYELAGIVTNLSAGWIAARFGLVRTLHAGLLLQVLALLALARFDPAWAVGVSVLYVMAVQGVSGVAKDLAKMSSKSAVKLLAPEGGNTLFRWVALLTGSKNAVKGAGFLLGAALLGTAGFETSVLAMAAILAAILAAVALLLPPGLPAGRKDVKFREVWSTDAAINRLSLARMFLFGARDVWFVVGIPVWFYAALSDGTPESNRAAFFLIGSFLAVWIILYGAVQAAAPRILGGAGRPLRDLAAAARSWVVALALIPALLALLALDTTAAWLTPVLIVGLLVFGFVFAVNSALHSFLILALSTGGRVTMDVGFYYMANAAGRLIGTLLSGLSYQIGGLPACLATAAALAGASAVAAGTMQRAVAARG